jgi:hypothetical protein
LRLSGRVAKLHREFAQPDSKFFPWPRNFCSPQFRLLLQHRRPREDLIG